MALICVVARLANRHELFAAPRRLASEAIAPETRLMWDLFRGSLGAESTSRRRPEAGRTDRCTRGYVSWAAGWRVALALIVALAVPCGAAEPFAQGLLWR